MGPTRPAQAGFRALHCMNSLCPNRARGTFRQALNWVLSLPPGRMTDVDGRWRPQADHCDLRHRIGEYNTIVKYEKRTFGKDMSMLLGCHHADFTGYNEGDTSDPAFVQYDEARSSAAKANLIRFYSPEVARRLLEWFREDYELFRLPTPAWIDAATGEFYDKPQACQGGFPLRTPRR